MQWTFMFCILISNAVIASSNPDESRHKRSLSFLTSLLFNDIRRTQRKCAKTSHCRPLTGKQTSAFSDRQKNGILPVSERGRDERKRKQTRTNTSKGAKNNGSSYGTNFENDPYQAASRDVGTTNTIARTATKKSNIESPNNIQNLSDAKSIFSGDSSSTHLPQNVNIGRNIYDIPTTYMTYAYEQPNTETVQAFAFNNNLDFIVPGYVDGYVDDGIENIIWSVPPYPYQHYPSFDSQHYEDLIMSPYLLLPHQQRHFGMNMVPNNYMSMYTGKPIIVLEDTSEKMTPPKLFLDSEINKDIGKKSKQKSRGDISD